MTPTGFELKHVPGTKELSYGSNFCQNRNTRLVSRCFCFLFHPLEDIAKDLGIKRPDLEIEVRT